MDHRPGARLGAALGLAGLAGVVAIVVFVPGGGGGGAIPRFAFGPDAGYLWVGRVRSLAASWSVPGVASGSSLGRASTWVAAQAPSLHGQGLFEVNPGDEISASLTLNRQRWTVQIRDTTSGAKPRFSTSEDAQASFNRAEWLQENAINNGAKPYPSRAF